MALCEPILQENKDRFVLFPIKHQRDLGDVQKSRSQLLDG